MQIITTTKQMAICIFTTGIFLKAYVTLQIGGRGITYNPPPKQVNTTQHTCETTYTVTHFEFELVLLLNNNSTRKTNVN